MSMIYTCDGMLHLIIRHQAPLITYTTTIGGLLASLSDHNEVDLGHDLDHGSAPPGPFYYGYKK